MKLVDYFRQGYIDRKEYERYRKLHYRLFGTSTFDVDYIFSGFPKLFRKYIALLDRNMAY